LPVAPPLTPERIGGSFGRHFPFGGSAVLQPVDDLRVEEDFRFAATMPGDAIKIMIRLPD
jgi:hypothetical protein